MEFIIVTGQSGAGKSHAVHCLEDLGYYAIDNMPPQLIRELVGLLENTCGGGVDKVAFVADIRGGRFFDDLKESLDYLEAEGIEYKVMFLEASDRALIRRYNETRRAHPLATEGSVLAGIACERERLSEIRKRASFIIDTTNLKVAALNQEIKRLLLTEQEADSFAITVQSFGFKHGIPAEADWVLDVRFLPNPFYLASLKDLTGRSKKVSSYVLKAPEAQRFIAAVTQLVAELIPAYIREGKYRLVLAIGCTGGQHRSVAIAEAMADILSEQDKHVVVMHRDL
ncbi:MAG TPA: RNase adapter RapZ [Clostridiales bacterium]|nr:RNase adapter RapZ [Clostridiales bacterium]